MIPDHQAARAAARAFQREATSTGNLARAYLALTSREPLTKRLREIYDFLVGYMDEHGYAPTFVEIGEQFGYSSMSTVHEHLANLETRGWIRRTYNTERGITLCGPAEVAS